MQSLLKYNTFGIDHSCKQIYEPATVEEIKSILPLLRQEPLLIIGGGSNLLLTKDFDGNVLHAQIRGIEKIEIDTSNYREVRTDDNVYIRCGEAETWDDLVIYAIDNGYYGIENLSIIPGEVGASAVQNIGAYGIEVKDYIYSIEAIEIATGKEVIIYPEDCLYAYRYSKYKGEWKGKYIITYVTYKLNKTYTPHIDYGNIRKYLEEHHYSNPSAKEVREVIIEIRNSKLPDPKKEGNAGSFFVNPIVERTQFEELQRKYPEIPHYTLDNKREKVPAGWLIEQCGWKGKTLGRAGVHDKQSLVLVNRGNAKGEDILLLCNQICEDVYKKFGIKIKPEVNIV